MKLKMLLALITERFKGLNMIDDRSDPRGIIAREKKIERSLDETERMRVAIVPSAPDPRDAEIAALRADKAALLEELFQAYKIIERAAIENSKAAKQIDKALRGEEDWQIEGRHANLEGER
jgi:hypothetical protein